MVGDVIIDVAVVEELLLEREPKPPQLASRDAADVVVVGDMIESDVLRSLSVRFKYSGFVFVEDDEKDDV